VTAEGGPYREVRSLERGLALLDAMADLGWSTPAELARRTAIDRSTVYRLLNTLVATGYAVRRPDDGRYFLAGKLGSIGLGIRSDDLVLQIAQEELDGLVAEVGWPSDYAALVAGRLDESTNSPDRDLLWIADTLDITSSGARKVGSPRRVRTACQQRKENSNLSPEDQCWLSVYRWNVRAQRRMDRSRQSEHAILTDGTPATPWQSGRGSS